MLSTGCGGCSRRRPPRLRRPRRAQSRPPAFRRNAVPHCLNAVLASIGSIKEYHNLRAGARCIGTERGSARSGCNSVVDRPFYSICVISRLRHVRKRNASRDGRRTIRAVQERHGLCAVDDCVGAERCAACAGRNAFFQRPQNCIIVSGFPWTRHAPILRHALS